MQIFYVVWLLHLQSQMFGKSKLLFLGRRCPELGEKKPLDWQKITPGRAAFFQPTYNIFKNMKCNQKCYSVGEMLVCPVCMITVLNYYSLVDELTFIVM